MTIVAVTVPSRVFNGYRTLTYEVSHPDALAALAQARFEAVRDGHPNSITYMSDIGRQSARAYVRDLWIDDCLNGPRTPDITTTIEELDAMIAYNEHLDGKALPTWRVTWEVTNRYAGNVHAASAEDAIAATVRAFGSDGTIGNVVATQEEG